MLRWITPFGVTVNACHPGDVSSTLSVDLGFGGSETPDQCAETPVWLATSKDVAKLTGRWFEHRAMKPDRFATDRAAIEALRERCASYA